MKKEVLLEFDIDKAKGGSAVKTREGNDVRILCYDRIDDYGDSIIALVYDHGNEEIYTYNESGRNGGSGLSSENDLMIVDYFESIDGVIFDENGELKHVEDSDSSKILFRDEIVAKRAIAMAKISQKMKYDERYGGIVTYAEILSMPIVDAITLKNINGTISIVSTIIDSIDEPIPYLCFHTGDQADIFLTENYDLLKEYFMLNTYL